MDIAAITVSQILAISGPEALFSGPDAVDAEYRVAAKRLHQDMPGGSKEAFQKLGELYEAAKKKAKIGEWKIPGLLELRGSDGHHYRIRYLKEFDCGVGKGYIGKTLVTYVLGKDLHDLVENATKTIASFKFANDDMKKEIGLRLPTIKKSFTTDNQIVLVIEKPDNVFRLRDVVDHYQKGEFDPKHMAWIISELENLACWMDWSGITHNEISLDSVFVCPQKHSVMLLGGWWFSVKKGERMARVQTSRTVSNAPIAVLNSKMSSIKTDLTLIRLLGREMLGDPSGMSLSRKTTLPAQVADWLRLVPADKAQTDYKQWSTTLTAGFGARRFTVLDLKHSDLYKE